MRWLENIFYYFQGRYGRFDNFTKFLILMALVAFALANILSSSLFLYLGVALLAYGLLRPVSKEVANRQKELQAYEGAKRKVSQTWQRLTNFFTNKNQKRSRKQGSQPASRQPNQAGKVVIHCPQCVQKLRVPTGKKLKITCRSCGVQFEKQT